AYGTAGSGYLGEQGVRDDTYLPTGQWVNVALVVSGDTDTERLYINGELVSSMSGITSDPSSMYSSSAGFSGYIGKSLYSADPYLSAKIDNFKIYGAALNPKDIQSLAGTSLNTLQNGDLWLDTNGEPIDAAGGCILKVGSTYYWYGNSGVYVNCYSSTDLVHWTFQNAILGPGSLDSTGAVAADLTASCVVERPKVIYNSSTGKYVLWFHYDSTSYSLGKVGVAICSTPTGDFTYQSSFNPGSLDSRDMTIYQDTDGSAYLISATVTNGRLSIFKLSSDYLTCTYMYNIYGGLTVGGTYAGREAPAIVKDNGTYYLITSACAGWYPNQAQYSTCTTSLASSTAASWSSMQPIGNSSAFYSQSTWLLTLSGTSGTSYMLMSDRNRIPGIGDQNFSFVWFPLTITSGVPSFDYSSTVALNPTAGTITNVFPGTNLALSKTATASSYNASYPANLANDGKYTTEWVASAVTYPSTWTVDLGATYRLNEVQLSWYLCNGSEAVEYYKIYTSSDGSTYTERRNNANNTTYGFNADYLGGVSARYVRIQINQSVPWNNPSNSWYTPQLYEVKVYGE
ncbi:MAG TPA: discoidin domain-containing protein, partial [Mobilitalea sp.]|nr:discoidin domain-containing protein [Mobilitalea sp.]